MPLAKHCFAHILDDPDQKLYAPENPEADPKDQTPVLNAAVNDLAREAPAEPFDFLINALLKAAKALAARAPMRICAFEA